MTPPARARRSQWRLVLAPILAVAGCFFNPTGTVPDPEPTETGATDTGGVPTTGASLCNSNGICDVGEDAANCPSDCAGCGDGIIVAPEVCDDGDANGMYGHCNNSCTGTVGCGDGIVQDDHEVCDDGQNDGSYGGCGEDCQALGPYCGDGVCQPPQEHATNCGEDGCVAVCGNGVLEPGEVCDDGVAGVPTDSASCNADCSKAACGDGYVNAAAGEVCDDGNANNNDACVMCQPAVCGDGIVWLGMEDCDDGNAINDDECSNNCESPRRVFVTSTSYQGNLGGLTQADMLCQTRAALAGLDGKFRAWLSSASGSPSTRLDTQFTGVYRRLDGATIAVGWADLTDGTLDVPISVDETGEVVVGGVWTHTLPDGTVAEESPCLGWTTNSAGQSARPGNTEDSDALWTLIPFPLGCHSENRLYCFENP